MTFDEAVKQMIKVYWETDDYDEAQSFKEAKYNKKYFKNMEEEYFPGEAKDKGKKKK